MVSKWEREGLDWLWDYPLYSVTVRRFLGVVLFHWGLITIRWFRRYSGKGFNMGVCYLGHVQTEVGFREKGSISL